MSQTLEALVGHLSQDDLRSPRHYGVIVDRFAERADVRYLDIIDEFRERAGAELRRREELALAAGELRDNGRWPPHFDIAVRT